MGSHSSSLTSFCPALLAGPVCAYVLTYELVWTSVGGTPHIQPNLLRRRRLPDAAVGSERGVHMGDGGVDLRGDDGKKCSHACGFSYDRYRASWEI